MKEQLIRLARRLRRAAVECHYRGMRPASEWLDDFASTLSASSSRHAWANRLNWSGESESGRGSRPPSCKAPNTSSILMAAATVKRVYSTWPRPTPMANALRTSGSLQRKSRP